MEPRASIVTLGVRDLARSRAFYQTGLGWPVSSASAGDIVFFKTGGIVVALYPWDELAKDATVAPAGSGFRGITLAHNTRTAAETDRVLVLAKNAGATIVKPAQTAFWGGYSGYFADLDGHLWEAAFNPHFAFRDDGTLALP